MLDDLSYIHKRDLQDALGIAGRQAKQLEQKFVIDAPKRQFDNLVLAGMGGSALGAQIATSWPGFDIPFVISRDYQIPAFVSAKTLFFASSYSGNTEETLSALSEAEAKGAQIVVITSGGKLAEIAKAKNYPLLLIPQGYQPRHTALFTLNAQLTATDYFGITSGKSQELAAKVQFLTNATNQWRAEEPSSKNVAKQLALELMGKSIVVYSGPRFYPAAYKWKISFNENAKHIAWVNQFPEFNHNEFLGWTKQPVDKPYAVIDIRSDLENPRIQKRFEVSAKLLSGLRPDPIVINAAGADLLEQLLWVIMLGEFVSIYLALLSNLNPTPVDLIERFKLELNN